ncbi:MAG: hypothetical protein OEV88_11795 [Gammaproteobacteria bacterium]|jgi:hypothetical protein|nr:hypothetical protein [Gammaproteobacteria bacterium]
MTLYDAMQALQVEAGSYPEGVRIWMRVMAVSFFAGIVFVPWRREAIWVVLMAIATLALLVAGKILNPDLSRSLLGSAIHLVLWPLVLWLLWSPGARDRRRAQGGQPFWRNTYLGWLVWVTALVSISLVLDAWYLLSLAR